MGRVRAQEGLSSQVFLFSGIATPWFLYHGMVSVLYIAVPAVLVLAMIGIAGFIWSVRGGQMDDLETPGIRALLDDDPVEFSTPKIQRSTSKEKGAETD